MNIVCTIKKCICPPETSNYVDDNDLIVCNSCGGWIEGQYWLFKLIRFNCQCQKCFCLNPVFDQNNICAECIYGIHEGVKNQSRNIIFKTLNWFIISDLRF
jgi:hypothetical protein